jgi:hypothetical protein
MTAETPPGPLQRFDVEMSAEVEVGIHADFVNLWHTPDTIVLDFASLRHPPYLQVEDSGTQVAVAPTRIVSRVRLPPRQMWELMRALEKELTAWENETGQRLPIPGE